MDTINLVCLFCVLILVLDWAIPFKTHTPPLPSPLKAREIMGREELQK